MRTTTAARATKTRPWRVLVAVDGSDSALEAARLVTRLIGDDPAEARLVTVLSYDAYPYSLVGGNLSDEQQRRREAESAVEDAQHEARKTLDEMGVRWASVQRYGHPADALVDEIESYRPDLVVMGRRGLSGPGRWLGSISDRVVHRTRVPVLLVP